MRFAQYKPRVTFTQRGAPHVWPDTPYLKHSRLAEWLHVDCHKHELAGCALPIPHLLVPAQVSANCCACVPSSVRRVDRTGVIVVDSPANLARRPQPKSLAAGRDGASRGFPACTGPYLAVVLAATAVICSMPARRKVQCFV